MSTETEVNEIESQSGKFPDLSVSPSAKPKAERSPALVEQEIADRKQYRQLRQYSFFGVGGVIFMLLVMFVVWTGSFGMRLFYSAHQADPATSGLLLTPIVVIGALVAVPLLALIRFVFRENSRIEDDKNDLTIWQLLVKELSDVIKIDLGRSKPAA